MNISDFAKRADEIIQLGENALATAQSSQWAIPFLAGGPFSEFRAAALSFLLNVFGVDHPFYRDFDSRVRDAAPSNVNEGVGILRAAKGEVTGGWSVRIKALVAAEIFSDFLEMAEYLLDAGFKDAAAVMTGSVLEEHLRQLCRKHGLPTTFVDPKGNTVAKKADTLNGDLANAGVYNRLDQKNITAWLDLRNKAAHGKYAEYTKDQVLSMHGGIAEFANRVAP